MRQKILTTRNALLAVLSVVLAVCLALGIVFAVPIKAKAEDNASGPLTEEQLSLVKAAGWFNGDGEGYVITEADYKQTFSGYETNKYNNKYGLVTFDVEIGSAEGLAYLSRLVYENAKVTDEGEVEENATNLVAYNVTLTADIDLENKLWIPIGTTSRAACAWDANVFRGTLDGGIYTIKNLSSAPFYNHMNYTVEDNYYIDCGDLGKIPFEVKGNEEYCWGLFGSTAGAVMENVTIEGVKIDMGQKDVGTQNILTDGVGALIGYNIGSLKLTNCVSGNPDNTDYINNTMSTGGLVGRSYSGEIIYGNRSYPYGSLGSAAIDPIVATLKLNSEIYCLNSNTNSYIMPYYEVNDDGSIKTLYYRSQKIDSDGKILTGQYICYSINENGKIVETTEDAIKGIANIQTLANSNFTKPGTNTNYNPTVMNLIANGQTELLGKIYSKVFDDMFGAGVTPVYSTNQGTLKDGYVLGTIEFTDCKNYINISTDNEHAKEYAEKKGGLLGYGTTIKSLSFENCENHGNITCGKWVGGLTSYFGASFFYGTEENPIDFKYDFNNCLNTGNITATSTGFAGGLLGTTNYNAGSLVWSSIYTHSNIQFTDCANAGNIKSDNHAGGITADLVLRAADATLEKCYNYGKVQGTADKEKDYSGGLIGNLSVLELVNAYLPTVKDIHGKGGLGATLISNMSDANYKDYNTRFRIPAILTYINNSDTIANGSGYVYLGLDEEETYINIGNGTAATGTQDAIKYDLSFLKQYFVTQGEFANNPFTSSLYISGGNLGTKSDGSSLANIGFSSKTADQDRGTLKIENQLFGNASDANVEKKYSGALTPIIDNNVVTGFEGTEATDDSDTCYVNIPAGVTKIADWAFAGISNLKYVTIENGNALTEIGTAAFINCPNINYILLPDDASKIVLGESVFGGSDVYLIAANSEQYKLLIASENYAEYYNLLTYVVKINYVFDGEPFEKDGEAYTEYRLAGQSYNLTQNDDGTWTEKQALSVGPLYTYETEGGQTESKLLLWYYDVNRETKLPNSSDVTAVLANTTTDEITLYAFTFNNTGDKVFVAKEGLVYDDNKTYYPYEINTLLHPSSNLITGSMRVRIKKFVDSYGAMASNCPDAIHDAGTYTLEILDGEDDVYELTVTIQRAVLDLADRSNLIWTTTESTKAQLKDGTLYIYKDSDGKDYPSTQLLTSSQIDQLGLSSDYTTRQVQYSIVSVGEEVTIRIEGNGYNVTFDYDSDVNGEEVGCYTAKAKLIADSNHVFSLGNLSILRGMTIELSDENTVAEVTKDWYIAYVGNRLIVGGGSNSSYTISDHVYGNSFTATAPVLAHTGEGGTITMHLYLNGTEIGNVAGFGVGQFAEYINSVMPAGEYRLVVSVTDVISREVEDDSDPENIVYADVVYGAFTENIYFTVEKAELPDLTALDGVLKGKTFKYVWKENTSHLYDESAATVVNAYLDTIIKTSRTGTIWAQPAYSNLYNDSFVISYNLRRMQSSDYTTSINTADADTYIVYYKISANNYSDSIESLTSGSRLDYYFTVINIREVELPAIANKTYDGYTLKADVTDGQFFTVKTNNGGVNAAEYDVVLALRDSVHYMWKGQTFETMTSDYTLKFTIDKADNDWTVATNVIRWSYNGYDIDTNLISGSVVGGTVAFSITKDGTAVEGLENITLTAAESGLYYTVSEEVAEILNGLDAGAYKLIATVTPDGNHKEIAAQEIEFNVLPAANDWKDSFDVIGWTYNGYNPNTNKILGSVQHGTVTFTVLQNGKAVEGLEGFTAVTDKVALTLTKLPVGTYSVTATVEVDGNYQALDSQTVTLTIAQAVNDWVVNPSVINWSYGNYNKDTNLISGSVESGTVTFTVTDSDGSIVSGLNSFTKVDEDIAKILGDLPAGNYKITATVAVDGNHQPVASGNATLTVAPAINSWNETPSIISWVKGEYNEEENVITVSDIFGSNVDISIYDSTIDEDSITDDNLIYKVVGGVVVIDKLAEAEVGHYTLKAVVNETNNYGGLEKTFSFQIFAPEGLAWWAWLLIIAAILITIGLVFFVLHQTGVLQMLTGRFVIAMRAKMTVDATIAAVRANKVAENARRTVAAAEAAERAEEERKAREEARNRPADEKAASIEEKAQIAAEKAEKLRIQAEKMQKRANKMKEKASKSEIAMEVAAEVEGAQPEALPPVENEASEETVTEVVENDVQTSEPEAPDSDETVIATDEVETNEAAETKEVEEVVEEQEPVETQEATEEAVEEGTENAENENSEVLQENETEEAEQDGENTENQTPTDGTPTEE